jgi:uncharacterized RDD family membrane protein YckC
MILDDVIRDNKELATPGQRFLASLIDGILGGVVGLIPLVGWVIGLV